MKKTLAILFSAILTIMLTMSIVPFRTLAADDDTYTVRVFAGEQGLIDGSLTELIDNSYPKNGTGRFTFDINRVSVNGAIDEDGQVKYQVLGVHEAGKEDHSYVSPSFLVTEDVDLVVVYGLTEAVVQYTVVYMSGTTELGRDVYYAYDGEKPVVAARYYENYVPQAQNITGTVVRGGANIWTLNYTPVNAAAPAAPAAEGEAAAAEGAAVPAAGGAAAPAAAEGGAAAPAVPEGGAVAPGGEEGAGGEATPEVPEPQEIIDIDEPDAPLAPGADPGSETETEAESETITVPDGKITPLGIVGIAAGGVVVAGGIAAVIVAAAKSRKKKG